MPVRVRFSPSPTGMFHVGSASTALYNRLFATQSGGTFLLRIEDTDTERNRPEWTQGILDMMRWIGAPWDEGPYFQSERGELYRDAAARLEASGAAYWCDCTRDAIDARIRAESKKPGYDGYCRDRALGPGEGRALRFRTPREGTTTVVDLIRGEPTFENALIEDFVLVRSNGTALFLLANVVDDIDMGITHVIRAEEHLPNTPKAILLWQALGGPPLPVFAHVPLLVNAKRQKLSKRRDKVGLEQYRDEGYLPEAMRNFLMLLGWSPKGDREIVPWEDVEREFRLDDVHSSPAYFDTAKLLAINGVYIRGLPVEEFVARAQPYLPPGVPADAFAALAPLVQERVNPLGELAFWVDFVAGVPDDAGSWQKAAKLDAAPAILDATVAAYEQETWEAGALKDRLAEVCEHHGVKLSKGQAPVRVATMGRDRGLPLFESLVVLGRTETLRRLREARRRL